MTEDIRNIEHVPPAIRWSVWERDDFRCTRCGRRRFLTVDHVKPRIEGGSNDPENLRTLCVFCNSQKGAGSDLPPFDPAETPDALERAALIRAWIEDARLDLRDAIVYATEHGASLRMIATAVGLSHSRIHQIINGK